MTLFKVMKCPALDYFPSNLSIDFGYKICIVKCYEIFELKFFEKR